MTPVTDAMPTHLAFPAAELKSSFKSAIAQRMIESRSPLRRWRAGKAVELYYEAGDPHSQLAAAAARQLQQRLKIPLHIHLVPAPDAAAYPEQAMQQAFARLDAQRLAPVYDLPRPTTLTPEQIIQLQAHLGPAAGDTIGFLARELDAVQALASGESLLAAPPPSSLLTANAERRRKLGHYLPAMWHYRGEWFWGLDRLGFLSQRLQADQAIDGTAPLLATNPALLDGTGADPAAPLEFWFSFRSPYSYLAAVQLWRRHERHQLGALQVRPVLPMVMRGLPVPMAKRMYIVRDTKRCAEAQKTAFGRVHDPVGDGVMRLLTVFPWQADETTQLQFCTVAGQRIWAEGLDMRRDDVLASVFRACDLDFSSALNTLAAGYDTATAEANRAALMQAGLWGVPGFRLGQFVTWGQDRLWMIDELRRRN